MEVVPHITGATTATSHFHRGTNRLCFTTDQQKIFPGDRNELLTNTISVCGVSTHSQQTWRKLFLHILEKEWGHIATRSSCVSRQREPWLLVVMVTVQLTATQWKPKLTPKERETLRHTQRLPLRQFSSLSLQWESMSGKRVLPFREKMSSTQRKLKLEGDFIVRTQNPAKSQDGHKCGYFFLIRNKMVV